MIFGKIKRKSRGVITIVSGLPRSGTSLMMKILEAGGMEVVVDNIRKADKDNPLGYYEYEKVKTIREASSWLKGAEGKAFKMVSRLLYDLPADNIYYKIIFMRRNMVEILTSQRRMLERRGTDESGAPDEEMGRIFKRHLAEIAKWIEIQRNMSVMYVSYNEIMAHRGLA